MSAILHEKPVDLRLDVLNRFGVGFQPSDIDFDIEVSNIFEDVSGSSYGLRWGTHTAYNRIILHHLKMLPHENVSASSRGHEYLPDRSCVLHSRNLIS